MSIKTITTDFAGQVGVNPRLVRIVSNDDYETITESNYLKGAIAMGYQFYPTDLVAVAYGTNPSDPNVQWFTLDITSNSITLVAESIVPYSDNGQVIASATSSATPGTIRALTGHMSETASVMTSGNVVGVRGEVDCVGASGGFLYGVQGKVIASGTLSGSSWTAGMFGQFDISQATVNAGQTACIWGDYGTSSGTITSATGMRGIAMTNTTSAVLNSQDYRYGNATYLLELAGAGGTLNYYENAGTGSGSAGNSTHCAAQKVIAIEINGVAAYIPVFTQNT